MRFEDIANSTMVSYATAFKEFDRWGSLFQSKKLGFTMQQQLASNWCWAATSNSVSHYYWFFSRWTQCKIVNAELGRTDACNTPTPSGANQPWFLDKALARTNNFVSVTGGRATFAQIRAEIDAGRPMGARIGWNGGGGHFVAIYGYSIWLGQEFVDIDDPISGKSHLSLDDFATNYKGSGTWTHYYITKSFRGWWWPDVVISPDLLTKIWDARQRMLLAAAVDPAHLPDAERDGSRFGLAQPIYDFGLRQLLSGDTEEPQQLGLRVYETVEGSPVAFFDVDDAGEGAVRSASTSSPHLDAFASAVSSAARLLQDGGEGGETRILQVPALNFEGLWVVDARGESSVVPMLPVGRLEVGRTYPLQEALESLREAAKPLADMDDMMGA